MLYSVLKSIKNNMYVRCTLHMSKMTETDRRTNTNDMEQDLLYCMSQQDLRIRSTAYP